MAHIKLAEGVPGIRGPMLLSPETTKPLRELVEVLLRSANSLTPAEREMIATYVSSENDCYYCQHSHGAAAAEHLGGNYKLIDEIKQNFQSAPISDKMKALLAIAGKVQMGGKHVKADDVDRAKNQGASDKEIHDTVLIAAAFCMFNRYVDGLATWAPRDPEIYREIGKRVVNLGYTASGWERPVAASSR
ncbi:MAG: peroxidase-related enzyme [Candidatus Acidiferrales bacterium]